MAIPGGSDQSNFSRSHALTGFQEFLGPTDCDPGGLPAKIAQRVSNRSPAAHTPCKVSPLCKSLSADDMLSMPSGIEMRGAGIEDGSCGYAGVRDPCVVLVWLREMSTAKERSRPITFFLVNF